MGEDKGRSENNSLPAPPLDRAAQLRRLWTLALLLIVVVAASIHFIGIADNPLYQVHSDDLIWIWRFQHLPEAARKGEEPAYFHNIDQGALERFVFHALLRLSGRMPEGELPEWDYSRDFDWNVQAGHIAPHSAVYFVRVVNAAFMIGAAAFVYLALARAVSPLAGVAGGLYFVNHPATVEILWSIGSDPLMLMLTAAALLLWVYRGETLRGALLVGLSAGLATSAKLNAGAVVAAYCLWLLFKGRRRRALLAGAIALAAFIVTNPIVWSRGVFGLPAMLVELLRWRSERAALIANHYPAYAGASKSRVFWYLLGPWWPLLPLLLVSRRFWRLEALPFAMAVVVVLNGLTVTAPIARYTFPIQSGMVLGVLAAYWPRRPALPLGKVRALIRRLSGGGASRPRG